VTGGPLQALEQGEVEHGGITRYRRYLFELSLTGLFQFHDPTPDPATGERHAHDRSND
jgi:hypothetical protein